MKGKKKIIINKAELALQSVGIFRSLSYQHKGSSKITIEKVKSTRECVRLYGTQFRSFPMEGLTHSPLLVPMEGLIHSPL